MIDINIITSAMLAALCNDSENRLEYSIIGKDCFYHDEKIGTVTSRFDIESGVLDIYYQPTIAVQYINVNFIITKDGCEFK